MDRFLRTLQEWFVHIAHDPAMPTFCIGVYDRDAGTVEYQDSSGAHVVPAQTILCSHILTAAMPYVLLVFEEKRIYAAASLVPTTIYPAWVLQGRVLIDPRGEMGR